MGEGLGKRKGLQGKRRVEQERLEKRGSYRWLWTAKSEQGAGGGGGKKSWYRSSENSKLRQ